MGERRVYAIKLKVRSPFLFEGTANARLGVDSTFVRDGAGRPIVPGTQMRGVLLAALRQTGKAPLLAKTVLEWLFGDKSVELSGQREGFEPNRGRVNFSDLVGPPIANPLQMTRIRIEEETGTVKRGMMQVIELSHPPGETCDFNGRVVIHFKDTALAPSVEQAFGRALRLIPAIGACKSAGFGEVVTDGCSFSVERPECRTFDADVPSAANPGRQRYRVRFDRPILVDSRRVEDNLFLSATTIPGAVFKGALATRLDLAGHDVSGSSGIGEALSQARFSHAFPLDDSDATCDLPLPLSLVTDRAGAFADVAHLAEGQAALWAGRPAAFAAHSKGAVKDAARTALHLPAAGLQKFDRTHVKIDGDALSAEDQKLFALRLVATEGRVWTLEVDTADVADPSFAALIHAALQGGLDPIGRTGAMARLTAAEPVAEAPEPGPGVSLMLTTPAVLFDPAPDPKQSPGEAYRRFFKEKLGGAILVNHFSQRFLSGGYVGSRFRPYGSAYYPFVLTAPGSVFRLELPTEEARGAVRRALRHGLPVPLLNGKEPTWRTCPFLPENGFGAVMISPSAALPRPADLLPVEAGHVR